MKIKVTKVTVTKRDGKKRKRESWDESKVIDLDSLDDYRREIQAGDPDKVVRFNYEEIDE